MIAQHLPAEFDHGRVGFAQTFRALAVLDDVDGFRRDADFQGFRLVRGPFELAVHLARHSEDGDFADYGTVGRLVTQVLADDIVRLDGLGAVEVDAARPAQADDGAARRRGAIVGALAGVVQVLAVSQRQAASGLRVDV